MNDSGTAGLHTAPSGAGIHICMFSFLFLVLLFCCVVNGSPTRLGRLFVFWRELSKLQIF